MKILLLSIVGKEECFYGQFRTQKGVKCLEFIRNLYYLIDLTGVVTTHVSERILTSGNFYDDRWSRDPSGLRLDKAVHKLWLVTVLDFNLPLSKRLLRN